MKCSYIDMHCDTLLREFFDREGSLYDGEGMQSLSKMTEAGQLCQFYAIFFPPKGAEKYMKNVSTFPEDKMFFDMLRDRLYAQVEKHETQVAMAHNYQEIRMNQKKGLSSVMLTVEDGRMVEGKMESIQYLYEKGVRAIALTWNAANCWGYPNSMEPQIMKKGLTDFGKEAVLEMNRIGMLVDVSHLSDGGFYDVASVSRKPFIASHSNCRELNPHPRNLTDDMIRILAEHGGVAGLNFGPQFVGKEVTSKTSRIKDLARHILHFVQTGGEDCIGLGTDFDGITGDLEISQPSQMWLLFEELKKKGLTERQLDKIAGENVLRVIRETLT